MSKVNTGKEKPLTHRQRQALATRQLIVEAATALFLEQGYAAATIEAIATRAGVAVSTVYAVFTNKRGLLKAIRETWHLSSRVGEFYERAQEEADPAKRLELYAHVTRRQWEMGASVMAIYTGAAAADPDAAAELRAALAGRRKNLTAWLEPTLPLLRRDWPPERLLAVYLALTRAEVYQELLGAWGWSADAYEAWLAETLKGQFLP